jgi:hypothetical protein
MQLGGGPSLLDPLPEKPLHMHWRTYHRLLAAAVAAEERSTSLLAAYLYR